MVSWPLSYMYYKNILENKQATLVTQNISLFKMLKLFTHCNFYLKFN